MQDRPAIGGGSALAHAYLERLAHEQDLRMLHIKGPVSSAHGLASPRSHSDADVLVRPDNFERTCQALELHGWAPFRDADAPRLMDLHSRAYRRRGWHCSIDVHRFYPGFFADPTAAFEHLWSRRVTTTVADWPLTTPSVVDLAAIVAVHAARDDHKVRSRLDLDAVVERFTTDLDVVELVATAHVLRAQTTLAPLFSTLDVHVEPDLARDEVRAWDVLTTNDGTTTAVHWYVAWRSSTWRGRASLSVAALRTLTNALRSDSARGRTRWRHLIDKLTIALMEVRRMRHELLTKDSAARPLRTRKGL